MLKIGSLYKLNQRLWFYSLPVKNNYLRAETEFLEEDATLLILEEQKYKSEGFHREETILMFLDVINNQIFWLRTEAVLHEAYVEIA